MFRHEQHDRDLDDELRAYVELLTAEKIKAGMHPDAARRAALLETGGVEQVKEEVRDLRPGMLIEATLQDLRYAARSLRKAPGFTIAAALTLAIGIGAATAIFSMVNGVLLRRLPIGVGDRLVHLTQPSTQSNNDGYSVLEIKDLDRQSQTLSGVAEYHSMSFQLYGHGEPLRVQTGVVSDKFFGMIGVKPILGRAFLAGEEEVGAPPVVLLSYRFWMDQFRGDPSIVGATFTMNDKIHHVIGVLPPLPGYPNENDMWMPAGACPFRSAPMMLNDRGMRMTEAYATLKPDVSLDRARTELTALSERFHTAFPAAYPASQKLRFAAESAREEMTSRARPVFLMLLATAAFLLVAAIANVANLSLARQMRRGRELALRVALGARSGRLYRQLLLESLLLTALGGVGGVLLAASGLGLLRTLATRLTPRAGEIHLDPAVLGVALLLSIVSAFAIAVAPFAHALGRRDVAAALRLGNAGSTGTRRDLRARGVLVVAQVTLACMMLVGAGLIGRSLMALERVDAGVEVSNVLTARLTLNFTKYNTRDARTQMANALLPRLMALPGITSAALASDLPLNNGQPSDVRFQIEHVAMTPGARGPHSDFTVVSPDYFRTVGIPVLRGRGFTTADRDTVNTPVIVNRRLVSTYWGRLDPIGTRITPDNGRRWFTVVGVVGDVRQNRLDADITDEVYLPILSTGAGDLHVFLRTTGATTPVIRALRSAVHDVDARQPVSSVQTLEAVRGAQLAEPRLTTTLLGIFAALALLLTATGLAGVIGYNVTQRLPEIAIRMALGADRRRVLVLVMRGGLGIVVLGLVFGLTAAYTGSRLIAKMLFHVTATDPITYGAVAAVILAMAAVACFIPSRRALAADPARVLRGT
jgi:predicted permease